MNHYLAYRQAALGRFGMEDGDAPHRYTGNIRIHRKGDIAKASLFAHSLGVSLICVSGLNADLAYRQAGFAGFLGWGG